MKKFDNHSMKSFYSAHKMFPYSDYEEVSFFKHKKLFIPRFSHTRLVKICLSFQFDSTISMGG
jgi:hypothetical protein